MAKKFTTPGVYIEEISTLPPSVAPVATAIPAFIGYTEKADSKVADDLTKKPFRISSILDYSKYFGGPPKEEGIVITLNETRLNGVTTEIKADAVLAESARSKHILFYTMQLFFANGGGPCWIVSVGKYKPLSGASLLKNELVAGLYALNKVDEPTLLVIPEAQNLPIADFKALQDSALLQCKTRKDRFVIMDVHGGYVSASDPGLEALTAINNFRTIGLGNDNLKYGAAYYPNIVSSFSYSCDEAKTDVIHVLNGTVSPAVKLEILKTADTSRYEKAKNSIIALPIIVPPSGAIAGIYALTDSTRGVWKAPANVSINGCLRPVKNLTKAEQEQMNSNPYDGKYVNAILSFTGKGTLVWGARTLAGTDNEWRYVNVSRFFIFVEESAKKSTEQFVFEPNTSNTWKRVQAMLENFLILLWRNGALQGMKPEHAFYVAVGLGKTMTSIDILKGRMIIEIGMAAVRPAEFIILRFSHQMA